MQSASGIENEPIDKMTIMEYVRMIRNKYYPEIDISFLDLYMTLFTNDNPTNKFYISSDMLATYGVLSIIDGRNSLQSGDVKRYLDRTKLLIENTHYVFRRLQTAESENGKKKRGSQFRDVYMMTKFAFSTCLIVSTNESKYRNYYLLLEECIQAYDKQQILKLSNENSTLIERLDNLLLQGQTREREHAELVAQNKTREREQKKLWDDFQIWNQNLMIFLNVLNI